jgi:hypothetical protein
VSCETVTPAESAARAERAERELLVQLKIIRVLKPLSHERRCRVMRAASALLTADELVPGVVDAFLARIPKATP